MPDPTRPRLGKARLRSAGLTCQTRNASAGKASRQPKAHEAEADTQLSVMLPSSVVKAVKVHAVERGETLRASILRALKADGFSIPESLIADRRAEANRRRG